MLFTAQILRPEFEWRCEEDRWLEWSKRERKRENWCKDMDSRDGVYTKAQVTWQEVSCVWLRGNQRLVTLPRVDAGCYDIIPCRYNDVMNMYLLTSYYIV